MRTVRFTAAGLVLAIVALSGARSPAMAQQSPAPVKELATTVRDGFTIAAVGDLIVAYPISQIPDPGFQAVLKLLRDADVATGNYESNVIDGRTFKGSRGAGFGGTPDTPADVKAMGFDLVARSNNHIGEFGMEGLLETNRRIEEGGLVYAGSGETYWAARAPRFVMTNRGRIGMVATAGSFGQEVAEPGRGEWPGRGGQSALRTTRIFMVPPSLWQSVKDLRQAFPNGTGFYAPAWTEKDIDLVGQKFRQDPKATKPYYLFEMNQQDLADILAMVREGKSKSDFMTVAIHAHHFRDTAGGYRGLNVPENEGIDTNPSIPDYMPVFAKAAIDAGADMFQGTGVHALRGIEIYKGRPIFYGLGEFVRQMDVIGITATGRQRESATVGGRDNTSPPAKFESVLPISKFDGGRLTEIRLYPVELAYDTRGSVRGIPRTASPEAAQRILARLQTLSSPLGTTIVVEGNIGVIRTSTPPGTARH